MLMDFYNKTIEETLKKLSSSPQGISRHESAKRLKQYGLNELTVKGDPLWRKLVEPFANVFNAVLGVAVVISLLHQAYFDAIVIIVIILVSAIIYYVQRFSTEKILRTLRKTDAQRVSVLRRGEIHTIDTNQLVPGDVISIGEGDKVPADMRIMEVHAVQVDESMLTGESHPVRKDIAPLKGKQEIYERTNSLFQGSFIISGQVVGVVTHTGNSTEFGHIASLSAADPGALTSPVQKKIDKLITYCMVTITAVAVVGFGLAIFRGLSIAEALQFVIALAVSAVPEGLLIAISVILVLGMRRMATKKALVRNMRAIETIGVITTIATDKTGTLTKNKLSVQEVWTPSWQAALFGQKNRGGFSSSDTYLFTNHSNTASSDPLDIALSEFSAKQRSVKHTASLVANLPFEHSLAMSGVIWKSQSGVSLAIKGAPEAVIARSRLSAKEKKEITATLSQFASNGYRVIAVASAELTAPLESLQLLPKTTMLSFHGLIAIADTLRPAARAAIATAQRAGVTVRMITGDHMETAYSIGKKLGLVDSLSQVFDCSTMNELSTKKLTKAVGEARVFSRVTPENKFRILQILKSTEVTAMTGDGVNDVPALSSAHVGVAMGSGSQIAKDAGDILLLNDDFSSIIKAMKEGRIIFANIRRMLFYLLSTNIGEVIVALGALIIGIPLPLVPIQILWINLVTDTTMVIPLGLEPGEKDTLKQKPISPTAPILSRYMITRIIIVAIAMGIVTLGLYVYFSATHGTPYGQTIAFLALVVMQWANAFNARSTYDSLFTRITVKHTAFWVGLGISILLQIAVFVGPLQPLLHVHPVTISDALLASGIATALAIIPIELHKWWGRAQKRKRQ